MISKNTDKTPVSIVMRTRQDSEYYEHKYNGTRLAKNSKTYLSYNDGSEPCTLVEDGGVIRLLRLESGTRMTFEKGVRHSSRYRTPMGDITVDVLTDSIEGDINGGSLRIRYRLYVDDENYLQNRINIIIEEI